MRLPCKYLVWLLYWWGVTSVSCSAGRIVHI